MLDAATIQGNALVKWEQLKKGQRVLLHDDHLDFLSDHFKDREDAEASLFFKHLVTAPNPNPLGMRSQYVGWIRLGPRNTISDLCRIASITAIRKFLKGEIK